MMKIAAYQLRNGSFLVDGSSIMVESIREPGLRRASNWVRRWKTSADASGLNWIPGTTFNENHKYKRTKWDLRPYLRSPGLYFLHGFSRDRHAPGTRAWEPQHTTKGTVIITRARIITDGNGLTPTHLDIGYDNTLDDRRRNRTAIYSSSSPFLERRRLLRDFLRLGAFFLLLLRRDFLRLLADFRLGAAFLREALRRLLGAMVPVR